MSFVYKLIMNSLYGRFGISPEYTSTEICGPERYREIVRGDLHIMYSESLGDRYILVCYRNSADCPKVWRPARNAAVQISASVTAYARIYMHRWVSRSDCYYTDTDSVVLSSELPESEVGPNLGQMKLEYRVNRGIFLALTQMLLEKRTTTPTESLALHFSTVDSGNARDWCPVAGRWKAG